jgi:hypothetical protein
MTEIISSFFFYFLFFKGIGWEGAERQGKPREREGRGRETQRQTENGWSHGESNELGKEARVTVIWFWLVVVVVVSRV